MIRKIFYTLGTLSILLTSGCDKISKLFEKAVEEGNIQNSRIPLARVNDKVLYDTELKSLFTDRMTHKDSVNIRDRYINNWIRRVITLEKATAQVDVEKLDIQRRLDDYKFQLIMHEYEREYIASNLDTLVTDAQIKDYYTHNSDDFILKSNIVKGIFLRYPNNAPDLKKITKWLNSSKEKDKEKLRSSAFAYADFVHLEDSVWLDLDELLFGTPFMKSQSDITKLLKRDRLWEASDESNTFIYQIVDYKIVDQTPPLQFVSNQVKNVILGKRKLELRSELDTKLYEDATNNNEYEIYVSDN
ncbi:hypothetical protein [Flammeovirga kamogawensis]|uniref:Peptidyl-prolyl cis-trans isomerase n=1 Tax=Flammeovirga kamogawensis TaxID=373891 RepID=A0ABX8GUN9_9BACT|nr:hypothetical protein [Flammeovirga kamogawensis]MBB6459833.1 hypothetical protein [Flammeovirga kamogawensis]QWG07113.1 hypothetical protein KM029_17695 [Flammeovirga kamogawensis]TRX68934.1 hypothetical protein EO216_12685 [Flammeovirga kamogawensis]